MSLISHKKIELIKFIFIISSTFYKELKADSPVVKKSLPHSIFNLWVTFIDLYWPFPQEAACGMRADRCCNTNLLSHSTSAALHCIALNEVKEPKPETHFQELSFEILHRHWVTGTELLRVLNVWSQKILISEETMTARSDSAKALQQRRGNSSIVFGPRGQYKDHCWSMLARWRYTAHVTVKTTSPRMLCCYVGRAIRAGGSLKDVLLFYFEMYCISRWKKFTVEI